MRGSRIGAEVDVELLEGPREGYALAAQCPPGAGHAAVTLGGQLEEIDAAILG